MSYKTWAPTEALSVGLKFLNAIVGGKCHNALDQVANIISNSEAIASEESALVKNATSLLFNLFEHVYTERENQQRLKAIIDNSENSVLDWGCGSGFFAINLALQGKHVTCFDNNPVCLQFIEEVSKQLHISTLISFDISKGNFTDVIFINVLDHIHNPVETISLLTYKSSIPAKIYIYAHFTNDGYHEAPHSLTVLREYLMNNFSYNRTSSISNLDIWENKVNNAVSWGNRKLSKKQLLLQMPIVFPSSWITCEENEKYTIHNNSFMVNQCQVGSKVWEIYKAIAASKKLLSDIALSFPTLPLNQFIKCIEELRKRNIILMETASY